MSLSIALDNAPEFYTNLEHISGKVVLHVQRSEQVGSIVVKLEGESITALRHMEGRQLPGAFPTSRREGGPGNIFAENHKLLYKVQQVFPDDYYASSSNPYGSFPLPPGRHEYPFKFKIPINNACSDLNTMANMGGLIGEGGFGSGPGIFGVGGIRVMDGTKQLIYRHTTQTLPPSLTGLPGEAEIRYYLKVTVQRPGLLKENWRQQLGFKFLPIEPPRPTATGQEAFARRPFTFSKTPAPAQKRPSLFSRIASSEKAAEAAGNSMPDASDAASAPSVEISARLPYPPILTCNKPVPLRLAAKKLVAHSDELYLVSFQMDLIGQTTLRANEMREGKLNRWVVTSTSDLCVPLAIAESPVGKLVSLPDDIWKNRLLPQTVAPSFKTCNINRDYQLQLKIGISWGKPKPGSKKQQQAQAIYLPLHFDQVDVYSGITPPPELVKAARHTRPGRATIQKNPRLPPRAPTNSVPASTAAQTQGESSRPPPQPVRPPQDPLYPPQLAPGQDAHDEAPPSYDEAMAENISGPFGENEARPAYSGVTQENTPSTMPREKH